jgi:hydroxymethylpyrimidine/phosphomethylpyrimidine kinase
MDTAVENAIAYLHHALDFGKDYFTGRGYGPVNHFYNPEKLK